MKKFKILLSIIVISIISFSLSYSQDFDSPDIHITPLGINTSNSELGAIEHENSIIYSSDIIQYGKKGKKGEKVFNIYTVDITSAMSKDISPNYFLNNVNTKYDNGPAFISKSEKKIYFTSTTGSNDKASGKPQLVVYEVSQSKKGWGSPKRADFNIGKYSTAHATVSHDGKYLVFSSNRKDSKKQSFDLWVIKKTSKGKWGNPRNISNINTNADESYPFFDDNGNLFFSSNRKGTLGKLDIYFIKDFIKGRRITKHLAAPINSQFDDFGVSFYPDRGYGYITSNRIRNITEDEGGAHDIYKFAINEGFSPPQEADISEQEDETTLGDEYDNYNESTNSYPAKIEDSEDTSHDNYDLTSSSTNQNNEYDPPTSTNETTTSKDNLIELSSLGKNNYEYRIQIAALTYPYTGAKNLIKRAENQFSSQLLFDEMHDGYKKILIGSWNSIYEARKALQQYKRNISSDAFIVEYLNGKRLKSYF